MPRITLTVGRDPVRLLEEAAEGFLTPLTATPDIPFPSPTYLLALRQGGVRDDLIALAAERGVPGWFDPPLCIFHELPDWLGATDRRPAADFSRAALLAKVVRTTNGEVFARIRRIDDFLEALERLIGELVAEDVTGDALARSLEPVGIRDRFQKARDAELVSIYRRYLAELHDGGLRDGRDTLVDCAMAVRADPAKLAQRLGGRREIRFFGLNDPRGGWRVLLRALAVSPAVDRIVIYASDAIDFGPGVEVDLVYLEESESAASRLFSRSGEGDGHFGTIEAQSVEREFGEVARRIRDLADRGVPLHQMAVISRQARPYLDLVLRALRRFGIPATARRRYAYREIPVVRAILALFAAAGNGWTRGRLVDLADLPYFDHRLDSRVLNYIGFRRSIRGLDAWQQALRGLEDEAREYEGELATAKEWREQPPPPSGRVAAARQAFQEFVTLGRSLERSRPLSAWLRLLRDFADGDPWDIETRIYRVPEDRFDLAKRDLAGWQGLRQILDEWLEAAQTWGGSDEVLGVEQFHQRLQEMLAGDVALWTETLRGVQVLEGLAAAYRSFDHVFLVGMEAGRFPLHAPRSPVIDERERAALVAADLPLDLQADWEERERNLFRVLVAGARSGLTLSYASVSATGTEVIRSAFIDALADVATEVPAIVDRSAVFTPGMPLYRTPAIASHAARVAHIERARELDTPSPYAGWVERTEILMWLEREFGDQRIWSPTQLEAYAKCPWAYFSSRLLCLEKLEDPDDEMEPTVRGSVLHDALARFFDQAVERNAGQAVFLRKSDLPWAESMLLEALDRTLATFKKTAWLGAPVLRGAKREELRRILTRYLRWEVSLHEDMFDARKRNAPRMLRTAVALHERRFDTTVLERDGVHMQYRGAVDRVEVGIDERIPDANAFVAAVDYKTTRGATPGGGDKAAWADGVVLQLPLYAYALDQLVPNVRVARVEYRSLVQPQQVHTLEFQQVNRKTSLRYPNQEDRQKFDEALEMAAEFVRRMRRGEFPVKPAPSCMCPRYCHAWDICRVAGGPKEKDRWR
jgi:hypothetical protein